MCYSHTTDPVLIEEQGHVCDDVEAHESSEPNGALLTKPATGDVKALAHEKDEKHRHDVTTTCHHTT